LSALSLAAAEETACCDDEDWKPVPGWPHEASTCGRVRSVDRLGSDGIWRLGAMLPQHPDTRPGKGYLYATLLDGKRRRKAHVAVLVLEAHRRLRPGPGWEASHLCGIRTDNHLRRLAWETREQNLARIPLHAAEKAVTDTRAGLSQEGLACHRSQVTRGAVAVCDCHGGSVTSASSPGTGSLCPIPISPSVFTSVQPLVHTLRTLFRSLRIRQAA
jgi:NUMOD4 motif